MLFLFIKVYKTVLYVVIFCIVLSVKGKAEAGTIGHIYRVSAENCVQECTRTQVCKSASYVRLTSLCTLFNVPNEEPDKPGIYIFSKSFSVQTVELCTNADCLSKNGTYSCGDPVQIFGTEILGNMVLIGSKIKYVCLDGSSHAISECLTNGSWSFIGKICRCSTPDRADELLNILSWSYDVLNSTFLKAIATCAYSNTCSDQVGVEAVCNSMTGKWSFTKNGCCNTVGKQILFSSKEKHTPNQVFE